VELIDRYVKLCEEMQSRSERFKKEICYMGAFVLIADSIKSLGEKQNQTGSSGCDGERKPLMFLKCVECPYNGYPLDSILENPLDKHETLKCPCGGTAFKLIHYNNTQESDAG